MILPNGDVIFGFRIGTTDCAFCAPSAVMLSYVPPFSCNNFGVLTPSKCQIHRSSHVNLKGRKVEVKSCQEGMTPTTIEGYASNSKSEMQQANIIYSVKRTGKKRTSPGAGDVDTNICRGGKTRQKQKQTSEH